jgi:hypothetical protein
MWHTHAIRLLALLMLLGLVSACAGSLQARHDQLAQDRAYAVAAIHAWEAAYRDGTITPAQWAAGRDAYRAWAAAQEAYLTAIQSGRDVTRREREQAQALAQFQRLTASSGIAVKGAP